jgi:hypothetical protein
MVIGTILEALFLAGVLLPTRSRVEANEQLVLVDYPGGTSLASWLARNKPPGVISDQWKRGLPALVRLPAQPHMK